MKGQTFLNFYMSVFYIIVYGLILLIWLEKGLNYEKSFEMCTCLWQSLVVFDFEVTLCGDDDDDVGFHVLGCRGPCVVDRSMFYVIAYGLVLLIWLEKGLTYEKSFEMCTCLW